MSGLPRPDSETYWDRNPWTDTRLFAFSIGEQDKISFLALVGDACVTAASAISGLEAKHLASVSQIKTAAPTRTGSAEERVKVLFDAMKSKDFAVLQSQLADAMRSMESLEPVEVMAVLRLTSSVRDQLHGWTRAVDQAAGYFQRRGMDADRELMGLRA